MVHGSYTKGRTFLCNLSSIMFYIHGTCWPKLHCVTSQKAVTLIFTAMRTSNVDDIVHTHLQFLTRLTNALVAELKKIQQGYCHSLSLNMILSQFSLLPILTIYFSNIHLNVTLPSPSHKFQEFYNQNSICIYWLPHHS